MKLCVLTSHNPRHYHVANTLAASAHTTLVVSSAMGLNPAVAGHHGELTDSLTEYFEERFRTELRFYPDRYFTGAHMGVLVVGAKEINAPYVFETVKDFHPDVIVVFGTNILKGPILDVCPNILNMHLGMSPYYNGSSTNFWPMYNDEYEYVGVTVHYIDSGVDTGNILGQTRAKIVKGDTPHTIGNKTILAGIRLIKEIMPHLVATQIPGIKQWEAPARPIYRMKDFTAEIERTFIDKIRAGAIDKWIDRNMPADFQMVRFTPEGPQLVSSLEMAPLDLEVTGARRCGS